MKAVSLNRKVHCIVIAVGSALMAFFDISAIESLPMVVAHVLRLVIAPLYVAFMVVMLCRRRDSVAALLLALAAFGWIGSALFSSWVVRQQVLAACVTGDKICRSLDDYFVAHGGPPADLRAWLRVQAASPGIGLLSKEDYRLEPLGDDGYRLSFQATYFIVHYRTRTSGWMSD